MTATENLNDINTLTLKSHQLLNLQTDFFLYLQGKGRSTNTLKNYKTDLDCFNSYLMLKKNNFDIGDFDLPQVKLYGDFLQEKYTSDNSRRRRVQTLRIFFDYLIERHIFSNNPVRSLPTSPKFLDRPRPTNLVDIKTLWQCLLEDSWQNDHISSLIARRNQLLVLFIYGAGLKVSDLHKLKTKHITFNDDDGSARVLVNHPKRDPYTIPLPTIFSTVYLDYLHELKLAKEISKVEFDEVLFNANAFKVLSGGLSARGIEMIFEDYRKKLIIEVTAKSLRQSCVFRWLQANHSDTTIKEWMGVAPSYSLKLYKQHMNESVYSDFFLKELYDYSKKKNRPLIN
jgi:site-specific recombinase XerD